MSLLQLQHITKSFNGVSALKDLSLEFKKETITGIIGPNGAGKTTLFNIISGMLPPDHGDLIFNEDNITYKKPWERAESGIGRLFQETRVFKQLTAEENVMTAFPAQKGEQVWKNFVFLPSIREQEKENREKTRELLEFVGLEEKAGQIAMELSFGQQKLLAIARLFAMEADLLLLDEPTSGVNPAMIDKLLGLIQDLPDQGKTVLLIEHNIKVVQEIADQAFFIDDGQLLVGGTPDQVLGNSKVRKIYMGV